MVLREVVCSTDFAQLRVVGWVSVGLLVFSKMILELTDGWCATLESIDHGFSAFHDVLWIASVEMHIPQPFDLGDFIIALVGQEIGIGQPHHPKELTND